VYNPPDTALLRAARARGCRVVGGLDMLVEQAAHQFEWWTGRDAPRAAMRDAARQRMEEARREAATAG
jgi:shikimate 5-dehydrogenase